MNVKLFLESLKYMGEGMLGIFIVMGIIYGLIAALTKIGAKKG
ncbi:MAG: sodium pump decarboxylase gamma subunit [Eubacteriales bacterium]|nr:sodium pump decarboxylase gamma subunit [Eubacteriales bacterium]